MANIYDSYTDVGIGVSAPKNRSTWRRFHNENVLAKIVVLEGVAEDYVTDVKYGALSGRVKSIDQHFYRSEIVRLALQALPAWKSDVHTVLWKAYCKFSGEQYGLSMLAEANESLKTELATLRRLVSKRLGATKEQATKNPHNSISTPIAKVSEMLAILGREGDHVVALFEAGSMPLKKLVDSVGVSQALRILNLLGWSETGYVSGDTVHATALGSAVGKAIRELV